MAEITVRTLCDDEVDEAYVVARLSDPSLESIAWRTIAGNLGRTVAADVILCARRGTGPICGVGRYRIETLGSFRPTFHLLQLAAVDISRPGMVATALMTEMLARARACHCSALRLETGLPGVGDTVNLALAAGLCRFHSLC
jgi:hypothetical protein